jgi:antitoxin YefM
VSEMRWNAGDEGDARRTAHNPEVAGSNPAPATKARGRLSNRTGLLHVVCKPICARRYREGHLTVRRFLVILLTMTVLPLGDVKSHLSELVGRVHDHHERVTVTVHGRPSAVLIAPEDLEALEETLEIMRDAATMNRLAESDAELARGEYVSAEELAEAMRRRQAH